jgi:thymidine kinase
MTYKAGRIEVICGCMFSGKTEELISRVEIAKKAGLSIAAFKPSIDTRYDETSIVSHNLNSIIASPVENSFSILVSGFVCQMVAIDEAQFFDEGLPDVCTALAAKGIHVIIAGLDMDYRGQPFGAMPNLMAIADELTRLYAVCVKCGAPATLSYRTASSESKILIGEKESYEPRCKICFGTGILS